MGFNPHRKHQVKPADYAMLAAALLIAAAFVAWAFLA